MGSLCGGIFASAGIPVIFFGLDNKEVEGGVERAVRQVRSDTIRDHIEKKTFEDMKEFLKDCDWVFEAVKEDLSLKKSMFEKIDEYRKKGSIVSTVSSGLSIENLAEERSEDFQRHFAGVHFYNPPGVLLANEIIYHKNAAEEVKNFIYEFCEKKLRRKNVITNDTPAFAGNRIGFQFLNEALIFAETHGLEKTDYLLGAHTGRAMPPLATVDLVGMDVHKAVVDNIYQLTNDRKHDTFKLPGFAQKMFEQNILGRKTKSGLFKRDTENKKFTLNLQNFKYEPHKKVKLDFVEKIKSFIREADYHLAADAIKNNVSEEAKIIRYFILNYISYSFSLIGEATPLEYGIDEIDKVMAHGFSWMPPSAWVDLFGGPKEVIAMMKNKNIDVPETLTSYKEDKICKIPSVTRYLIAK